MENKVYLVEVFFDYETILPYGLFRSRAEAERQVDYLKSDQDIHVLGGVVIHEMEIYDFFEDFWREADLEESDM